MLLRQLFRGRTPLSLIIRGLSSANPQPSVSVDKEALMKLRKRTGYSYVNCRKALVQFGSENIAQAEEWLRERAKTEGWAKAAKLSGRATTQGLVGVKSTGSLAAIVELSCETDFVARGESFKNLLEKLTESVVEHMRKNIPKDLPRKILAVDLELQSLVDAEGKALSETLTMAVGRLGENIAVRSIRALYAPEDTCLYSASHPREGSSSVSMGRFVSVIALKRASVEGLFPTDRLAAQLCQHVIGMRSETLGEPPQAEKSVEKNTVTGVPEDELNEFAHVEGPAKYSSAYQNKATPSRMIVNVCASSISRESSKPYYYHATRPSPKSGKTSSECKNASSPKRSKPLTLKMKAKKLMKKIRRLITSKLSTVF